MFLVLPIGGASLVISLCYRTPSLWPGSTSLQRALFPCLTPTSPFSFQPLHVGVLLCLALCFIFVFFEYKTEMKLSLGEIISIEMFNTESESFLILQK